jgi:hypothetical protein
MRTSKSTACPPVWTTCRPGAVWQRLQMAVHPRLCALPCKDVLKLS